MEWIPLKIKLATGRYSLEITQNIEENIKKKETEPNAKQYAEAMQMFYYLSKRHYRETERETFPVLKKRAQQ